MKTIYIVAGYPRVGKSTTAEFIADIKGVKKGDTSDIIYEVLASRRGTTVEALKALPKESVRPDLISIGNSLCNQSSLALAWPLIERGCGVVCGIRRMKEEFIPLKVQLLRLGIPYVTIWVDNPNVPKIADNTTISKEDCDIIINNYSTVGVLKSKLEALLK